MRFYQQWRSGWVVKESNDWNHLQTRLQFTYSYTWSSDQSLQKNQHYSVECQNHSVRWHSDNFTRFLNNDCALPILVLEYAFNTSLFKIVILLDICDQLSKPNRVSKIKWTLKNHVTSNNTELMITLETRSTYRGGGRGGGSVSSMYQNNLGWRITNVFSEKNHCFNIFK